MPRPGHVWDHGPYDYVDHLADYAAEGLSHFVRRFNYETNLIASVNLINLAIDRRRGAVRLHLVDRRVRLGPDAHGGVRRTEAEDPYGVSKYAVELDLRAAHELFGLDYTVFRPHDVYGERQNVADRYRNVIGIFTNAVLHGDPLPVFGDGTQTRAVSHNDVAPLIARSPLVAAARNEVFNVGADTPYSILELAAEIGRAFDAEVELAKNLPPSWAAHLSSRRR